MLTDSCHLYGESSGKRFQCLTVIVKVSGLNSCLQRTGSHSVCSISGTALKPKSIGRQKSYLINLTAPVAWCLVVSFNVLASDNQKMCSAAVAAVTTKVCPSQLLQRFPIAISAGPHGVSLKMNGIFSTAEPLMVSSSRHVTKFCLIK